VSSCANQNQRSEGGEVRLVAVRQWNVDGVRRERQPDHERRKPKPIARQT
jgi:hypothetical protein